MGLSFRLNFVLTLFASLLMLACQQQEQGATQQNLSLAGGEIQTVRRGLAGASLIRAASCERTAVQTAISSASAGDTVVVPAGNCSWSGGIAISGIQLIGAGSSTAGTVITAGTVTLTKSALQTTRLSGFRFSGSDKHFEVNGSPTARAFILDNNYFFVSNSELGAVSVNGGVIHHNEFYWPPGLNGGDYFKITSFAEGWTQAPTFGAEDVTGERNIYLEDNKWTNFSEVSFDGDSGSRLVIRRNTFIDSSFTFHGGSPADSSANGGVRQFEIYGNTFIRVNNNVPINKWIWVRGGTGVIANNKFDRADSPDGSSYPNKNEILLTLACSQKPGYPVQYQTGQSLINPEAVPSHPLAIYGNTGAGINDSNFLVLGSSNTAGGSCANYQDYLKVGRDYVLSQTWNYTPYTYPHPLVGGAVTAPEVQDTAPPSLAFTSTFNSAVSGVINLSANASDASGVAGVQFKMNNTNIGAEDTAAPYATTLDTRNYADGNHSLMAVARDAKGNMASVQMMITIQNTVVAPVPLPAMEITATGPLPQGNTGIASQFAADANIQSHANVLFSDDFESYTSASQLTNKWDQFYQGHLTRISTESGNFFGGSKALEFSLPQVQQEVSNAVVKNVSPTLDLLFVRVYTKFDSGYQVLSNSNHNGIRISARYPGPGTVPNGSDFFLFLTENAMSYDEATPGYTRLYVYHPEQRSQWGDVFFPDGKVIPFDAVKGDFGASFVSRPNFVPERGRWYSYEMMVKANTAGLRDGRAAIWIDGKLVADFQNLRARDVNSLKIDQVQLELHTQVGGSLNRINKKYYDNVVVAKSYIGPVAGTSAPAPVPAPVPTPTPPPVIQDTTAPVGQIIGITSNRRRFFVATKCQDNVAVTKVEMYLDGKLHSSSTSQNPTFTISRNSLRTGSHVVQLKIYDAAGNVGTSASAGFNK